MNEPDHPSVNCSEKLAFATLQAAKAAAIVAAHRHGHKLRPYQCRFCPLWHLTSNPADE